MDKLLQEPVYVFFVLLVIILVSNWLSQKKIFNTIGAVILVIAFGAIASNTGLLPTGTANQPVYQIIFSYLAPMAIFYLLLDANLSDLRKAGWPMMLMFIIGAAATVLGVLGGYLMLAPGQHGVERAPVIAGLFTGTYIGGSVNLNALALQYDVASNATLFATVNAVDNLVGTIWILATILLPKLLNKNFPVAPKVANKIGAWSEGKPLDKSSLGMRDLVWLLALGFGALFIAKNIPQIPEIITLTTIGLVLAQLKPMQKIRGSQVIGMFFVLLFLTVIGTLCDLGAVAASGPVALRLALWVAIIILVHGLIIFTLGKLLKTEWDVIAVASNAVIGGSMSAPVCAASIGRTDLQIPGILAGSLGNALGTYVGYLLIEALQKFAG